MNKLTAMQQLIDELRMIRSATHTQEQYNSFNIPIEIAVNYLDAEKEQIINAFDSGDYMCGIKERLDYDEADHKYKNAAEYYAEIYNVKPKNDMQCGVGKNNI